MYVCPNTPQLHEHENKKKNKQPKKIYGKSFFNLYVTNDVKWYLLRFYINQIQILMQFLSAVLFCLIPKHI